MTLTVCQRRWSDWVGNARTRTTVNPSVIIVGDQVRQHLFQMPISKRDQVVQALTSDRPPQTHSDEVCLGSRTSFVRVRSR